MKNRYEARKGKLLTRIPSSQENREACRDGKEQECRYPYALSFDNCFAGKVRNPKTSRHGYRCPEIRSKPILQWVFGVLDLSPNRKNDR
jgi:hypothetical protein